jgi:dihydroxy-acid dehydratase
MPGSVMAMGRLNRPAIMVYGGISGKWKGESLNIVSAFEALGKSSITRLRRTLKELFNACPGAGACGGVYS